MKFVFAIVLCFCLNSVIRIVSSQQEIGDQCITASREKGTCMQQTDCVEREHVSHNNEFETCKLHADGTPIICCVSNNNNNNNNNRGSTTKRDFATRFGGGGSGSNEVTSSSDSSDTETKFYNGPKKKTYSKQPHKSTSSKSVYHDAQTTSSSGSGGGSYHKSSHSFGDFDTYSQPSSSSDNFGGYQPNSAPSPTTFDSSNYYEPSSNRRPEYSQSSSTTNYYSGGSGSRNSNSNENSYSQSGNRNYRPPPVAIDGLANNHRQQQAGNSDSWTSHSATTSGYNSNNNNNRNSENRYGNRNANKVNYNGGGYSANSNSGGDDVYYPNNNNNNYYESQTRPSTGHSRPSSNNGGGQQSNNGYKPSNNNGGNSHNNNGDFGGSSYEQGWTNQHRGSTTRKPSNSNEEPIWGTTERSTTRRSTTGKKPASSSQPQRRISEQKCSDYSRIVTSTISAIPLAINGQATTHKVTDCHLQATSLIVGGSKAKLGEYPHMASLGFRSASSMTYNCGGTLISEEYVLTAAHCTHSSLGNPVVVRLGDLNLERDDDGAQPLTVNVSSITVHPNYKPPQIYHDIALIKLARRVSFNKNLRPACLQVKREISAEKVVATGWGSTNYGEISSDDLLKVGLDIIESNQCNALYGPDQKFPKGITSSILCAGDLSGKKDTCQGDSGGPLQIHDINNKCIHYVIGITSSGKLCAAQNSPGIYTRVSEYIPWIESIVWRS